MPETCDHSGCTGRVVCVVQDVVLRRRTDESYRVEPDGEPVHLCSDHQRKYRKRRGRPIGEPDTHSEQVELPF